MTQRADATQREEAFGVARLGLEIFGGVDILVNVVGGIRATCLYTPFLEMPEAQWDTPAFARAAAALCRFGPDHVPRVERVRR